MTVNPDQIHLPITEFQSFWETNGIFSDHYMRTKLKDSVIWPDEEIVKPIWEFCKSLWNKRYFGLTRSNEEVLRLELLNPILEQLGFGFLPNISMPVGKKRKEPDYILFADEKTKDEVFGKSKYSYYAAAVAVLEAKRLNHALDSASKKETPGKFPDRQIRDYLQDAIDQSRKPYFNWAVLTNGVRWRLYCRNSLSSDYFEINFEVALSSFQNFMVFYTLFSPPAFIQDSENKCPLDYLREEALQVQTKLEDDLRKRVFNILRDLANGFFRKKENHISEDDLGILYDNCLIFLYRLLFILYAEGRGLLPIKPGGISSNKNYRDRYSIAALIPKLKSALNYDSDEFTELYERLLGLFHLINGNQPSRNKACQVHQYNGGLFDQTKHQFLERWRIGERTMADVLRGLVFSSVPANSGETLNFDFGETIDYADLHVRQLGSIYEGLLEHHLELEGNHLELIGDRSDRKATGTYYTPDYIVQYIVEKALLPLCESIEKLPKVQKAKEEKIEDNSFAKEVLKLNVLDPAMGSGHFLVRATEFLADQIVYHQTTALHIKEVPRGLSHEQAEISYWRRRVVESCIYGVDLNPLAVELAKLSLWLTCIAVKQPLSFLDHHLRPGNSLIGAKLSELGSLPEKKKTEQISFSFGPDLIEAVSNAIKAIIEIEDTETINVLTVKNKETKWQKEVYDSLEAYRTVADLWISNFFGLEISKTNYQQLAKRIAQNPKPRTKESKSLKKELIPFLFHLSNTKAKLPFHWELEFPEVFFNEDGSPKSNHGFDAVIGNPPYIGFQGFKEDKSYFRKHYLSAIGRFDIYLPFIEMGLIILRKNGLFGYICPTNFTKRGYGKSFRKYLKENINVLKIVDFQDVQIFKGVMNYTGVFIFKKSKPTPQSKIHYLTRSLNCDGYYVIQGSLNNKNWIFRDEKNEELIKNIEHRQVVALNEMSIGISEGIVTGKNEVFLLDREKLQKTDLENEIIKPCIRGRNIRRYFIENVSEVIIYPYEYVDGRTKVISAKLIASDFPNTWKYLQFQKQYLSGRSYLERSSKLWYELWNQRKLDQQNVIKIIVPELSETNRFSIADKNLFYGDTVSGIVLKESVKENILYVLGILNSKLIEYYYKKTTVPKANQFYIYKTMFLKDIPIRKIDFDKLTDKASHDKIVKLVDQMLDLNKKLSGAEMDNEIEALKVEINATDKQIDQLVYELYGLTDEEIKIVEAED